MQFKLASIIVISIQCGWPIIHATASSVNASTIESQERQAASLQAVNATNASEPLASHAGALQQRAAPNCDGETPSATSVTSVTALLSRVIRSSGTIRGVQCPIPPVHEPMPSQETHP